MFHKILVPLDGSALAERALQPALALAQQTNATLILLQVPVLEATVVPAPAGYGLLLPEQSIEIVRSQSYNYLQTIARSWAYPGVNLSIKVAEGDEAGGIVDTAANEGIDLIVMSTHGRTGLSRWVLGSITERVLHSAPCPVLVIRSADPLTHVLITLDGSELAEVALRPGLELARRLGSKITLLHVLPDMAYDPDEVNYLERMEQGLRDQLHKVVADSEGYLDELAREQPFNLPIRTALCIGTPAESILEYADLHHANLIVMATHGRTGLRRWLYGSVTEKVLRGTNCSMLVVRP
jgi:nucleotide-binding universal stress UspA family protein